jgi:hypothetical protein
MLPDHSQSTIIDMKHLQSIFAIVFLTTISFLSADEPKGTAVKLDKFSSTTPKDWKSEKPWNRLRSHQFRLPAEKGVKDAEVYIFPDLTKTPEENFARYKRELFVIPEGKTAEDISKSDKWEVGNKIKVFLLDMQGTMSHKDRPFDPKAKTEILPDYRAVSVIMETPDGNFLIRLWGPIPTVEKHYQGFIDWIKGFK